MLLFPAAGGAKGAGPYYFTAVHNGAYDFKGGAAYLEESYKALEKMVQLADDQHVRLTLLFSAQYSDYISSAPARVAALEGWKKTGHEIGAYHQGPDTKAWDGYSDLSRGANGFIFTYPGPGGAKKRLSTSYPSDKTGIETAKKNFAAMEGGLYGASFKSSPSEFGAFYAWLQFLKGRDPEGAMSRTVAGAVEGKLVAEKAAKAAAAARAAVNPAEAVPAETEKAKLPRLKPKRSPYSQVDRIFGGRNRRDFRTGPRGYCGDGVCDVMEKSHPGRCPRDCGAGK